MKRLLPSPILSCVIFLVWLALSPTVDASAVLLGAVLGLVGPAVTLPLRPTPVRVRRPLVAVRLLGRVVLDSLRSNLAVMRGMLRPRALRPSFVRIPLDVRDPNALAVLAMIVTATPGTAWAELAPDRSALLLHVFSLADEQALVELVKRRYERPLREIFE